MTRELEYSRTITFNSQLKFMEETKKRLLSVTDKDNLLKILVEECRVETFYNTEIGPIYKEINLNKDELNGLLHNFNRLGLIDYKGLSSGSRMATFIVHQEAHDFFSRGGFTSEEIIVNQQLLLLQSEIENLNKSATLETINKITTIAANLATSVGIAFGLKK